MPFPPLFADRNPPMQRQEGKEEHEIEPTERRFNVALTSECLRAVAFLTVAAATTIAGDHGMAT